MAPLFASFCYVNGKMPLFQIRLTIHRKLNGLQIHWWHHKWTSHWSDEKKKNFDCKIPIICTQIIFSFFFFFLKNYYVDKLSMISDNSLFIGIDFFFIWWESLNDLAKLSFFVKFLVLQFSIWNFGSNCIFLVLLNFGSFWSDLQVFCEFQYDCVDRFQY